MKFPNMCQVFKTNNGKVVSIADKHPISVCPSVCLSVPNMFKQLEIVRLYVCLSVRPEHVQTDRNYYNQ